MKVSHLILSLFLTTACATQSTEVQRTPAFAQEYAFDTSVSLNAKIRGQKVKSSKYPGSSFHLLEKEQQRNLISKLRKKNDPCLKRVDEIMKGASFSPIKNRLKKTAERANSLHQKVYSYFMFQMKYPETKIYPGKYSFIFNLRANYINEYEHPSKPVESIQSIGFYPPTKDIIKLRNVDTTHPTGEKYHEQSRAEFNSHKNYVRSRYKIDFAEDYERYQCNKDSNEKLGRILSYSADWFDQRVTLLEKKFKRIVDKVDSQEFKDQVIKRKQQEIYLKETNEYIDSLK